MGEWRSVKSNGPPGLEDVLCYEDGNLYVGNRDSRGKWWTDASEYNDGFYSPTCNPSHWMPLPEPPQ